MTIKEQLMADLKIAMRAKDSDTRNTIRLLQAAIKQKEIDSGEVLKDEAVLPILQKQAKQRRESIEEYEKAGRTELTVVEKTELAVIERYLPAMMSADEIKAIAAPLVAELGVTDVKGMGRVMGRLMPLVKGKADGKLVNQVVRNLINT